MPQPLPISKRKTQNHLTTNKNINKHRTNMFVFMSKKKNHFCLLPTPFVLFDVVHRRLHEKKDKNASIYHQPGFSSSRKFLTEKNVFIPKRFAFAINLLRRQKFTWRLWEPLELLLFPISTSPTLTLLFLSFLLLSFFSVSLNLLIFFCEFLSFSVQLFWFYRMTLTSNNDLN